MPSIQNTDDFNHGNFAVPGGGPYIEVVGTPAKDTGTVYPGDPASGLFSTATDVNEFVGYEYSPQPTIGWMGFKWRMNTGDEETIRQEGCIFYTTGFTYDVKLAWEPSNNTMVLDLMTGAAPDGGEVSLPLTLDAWHYIQLIYDVRTSTHKVYVKIDGVDMAVASKAGLAATTVRYAYIGQARLGTTTQRYSRVQYGLATSITDFTDPTPTATGFQHRGMGMVG